MSFLMKKLLGSRNNSEWMLKQLDWWEVIQEGDWCMIAGENVLHPVNFSTGWTVDRAFGYYRKANVTALFYRLIERKRASKSCGFFLDFLFSSKIMLKFSTSGWKLTSNRERRTFWFYLGKSETVEGDIVIYNLVVLWFLFAIGFVDNKEKSNV
jgi:hypothetical protein